MEDGVRLFGGFQLSPRLAQRVFDAVGEIQLENIDPELSHLSDDQCTLCRHLRRRRPGHDAPEADRTRIARTA